MRRVLSTLLEAVFRVLFTYDCRGEENVPAEGGAVVAANHPSYLDPLLLSLQVPRPIRFMAWDKLFRVPLLGALLRAFGAFPVDVRPGQGRQAFERARSIVEAGEVVGIFPEGKRSRAAWMEPALRAGAARLAWETGAPLVPATINGAYRAWPHFQSLPRPARVRVRFHEPIDPRPLGRRPEEEAVSALLAELRARVERSLLPGVKADLRRAVVYGRPSPFPRAYEWLPPLALALVVFWRTRSFAMAAPAYLYVAALLADHLWLPQSWPMKWLRNASVLLFLAGYAPLVLAALALPPVAAPPALAAILCAASLPYLYERGRVVLAFVRGMVVAAGLGLVAVALAPTGVGPHASLPLFAAAFAWDRRSVFWRYSAPVLLAYTAAVWRLSASGPELLPHVAAGLIAWLLCRLLPEPGAPDAASDEPGLGLRRAGGVG